MLGSEDMQEDCENSQELVNWVVQLAQQKDRIASWGAGQAWEVGLGEPQEVHQV